MVSATALLLISPLKNLVVNVCMASFKAHGYNETIGFALDIAYMPVFGTVQMQIYTALAYVLMLWGTAMQVNLIDKLLVSVASTCCTRPGKATLYSHCQGGA